MQFLFNNNFQKFKNLIHAHKFLSILPELFLVHNVNNFRNIKLNNLISQLQITASKKKIVIKFFIAINHLFKTNL